MNPNLLYDAILRAAPQNRKRTPAGFISFCGPCCINNGQTRPDTKKRAGVKILPDGGTLYHCFNCKFTCSWSIGKNFSNKVENLLGWFGVSGSEIKKLAFDAWRYKEMAKANGDIAAEAYRPTLSFAERSLPEGSQPLSYWLSQPSISSELEGVISYLHTRGDHLFNMIHGDTFWWTPKKENSLNGRALIPFYWDKKIVGWTARASFPTKYRYFSEEQNNYLFNTEVIEPNHEWIILTEGPFDAIAIGGVATLGDHMSTQQAAWLNSTGKKILVLPDREKQGGKLVDAALEHGWYVSFPRWDRGVKDAAEATKVYGKLYALWTVIDARTANRLEINVKRKLDLK